MTPFQPIRLGTAKNLVKRTGNTKRGKMRPTNAQSLRKKSLYKWCIEGLMRRRQLPLLNIHLHLHCLARLTLAWLACVASVSVWFRSKERTTFGFGRARNETKAKKWKSGEGEVCTSDERKEGKTEGKRKNISVLLLRMISNVAQYIVSDELVTQWGILSR